MRGYPPVAYCVAFLQLLANESKPLMTSFFYALCVACDSHGCVVSFKIQYSRMALRKTYKRNFKGNSPNVLRFIENGGNDFCLDGLVSENLAAGAKLAAKNRSEALDEKTSRTYERRLMTLEKFAFENGDDTVWFGPGKRPFLAATIQTFLREYYVLYFYFGYIT